MYRYDNRVVITLDAGGTNLVFGAMQANKFIVEPITKPSNADNLDKCLATMVEGFQAVIDQLEEKPVAISFAFPGPADYPNGIIGGYLPNFPSFREGVALGPFLEYKFGIPVFINNDGDLFAYGEALGGALPEVNAKLEALGCPKRYKNLVGYTFGTGFGIGVVVNNQLNRGDNSCVETFCLKHKKMPDIIVEDGVAVRAIKRVYGEVSGDVKHAFEPKDICEIADGKRPGDVEAAKQACIRAMKHIHPGDCPPLGRKLPACLGTQHVVTAIQTGGGHELKLDITADFAHELHGYAALFAIHAHQPVVVIEPARKVLQVQAPYILERNIDAKCVVDHVGLLQTQHAALEGIEAASMSVHCLALEHETTHILAEGGTELANTLMRQLQA